MTDYTKSTNFATKDNLSSGNPLKIVKGTEINTEFDNIQTAVNSKADKVSPTFTGTVTIPTLSYAGTTLTAAVTGTGKMVLDASPTFTGTVTAAALTTTGNNILGNASTDTLNVGNGDLVKDASGNVGIGTASPSSSYIARYLHIDNATSSGLVLNAARKYSIYSNTSSALSFLDDTAGVERMRIDSSGNVLIGTISSQTGAVLAVTGGIQGTIKSGTAVTSTSGTSIDFTSIPSWVKRITVMFNSVSTNGTSFYRVQLGAGSVQTSGYSGATVAATSTSTAGNNFTSNAGFEIRKQATASDNTNGQFVFALLSGALWSACGTFTDSSDNRMIVTTGVVTLSGALDRVRITTVNGTDTFDTGSINILYEG